MFFCGYALYECFITNQHIVIAQYILVICVVWKHFNLLFLCGQRCNKKCSD